MCLLVVETDILNVRPVYTKLKLHSVKNVYKNHAYAFYLVGSHTSLEKAHIHAATETNVSLQYTCVTSHNSSTHSVTRPFLSPTQARAHSLDS
jgi:hypothetical protein